MKLIFTVLDQHVEHHHRQQSFCNGKRDLGDSKHREEFGDTAVDHAHLNRGHHIGKEITQRGGTKDPPRGGNLGLFQQLINRPGDQRTGHRHGKDRRGPAAEPGK